MNNLPTHKEGTSPWSPRISITKEHNKPNKGILNYIISNNYDAFPPSQQTPLLYNHRHHHPLITMFFKSTVIIIIITSFCLEDSNVSTLLYQHPLLIFSLNFNVFRMVPWDEWAEHFLDCVEVGCLLLGGRYLVAYFMRISIVAPSLEKNTTAKNLFRNVANKKKTHQHSLHHREQQQTNNFIENRNRKKYPVPSPSVNRAVVYELNVFVRGVDWNIWIINELQLKYLRWRKLTIISDLKLFATNNFSFTKWFYSGISV